MVDYGRYVPRVSPRTRLGLGAAALLALGVAGGAGAVSLTRPAIEMAPTVPTAIAKLPQSSGVVTVRGRVAEIYGDRFVVQDGSGRTLVNAGRDGTDNLTRGTALMVQGHYDNGQLRASYLVDPQGRIDAVGAPPPPPHGARRGEGPPPPPPPGFRGAPGDGPPPPPPGAGAPPPPPPGAGAPPPPPPAGDAMRGGPAAPPPPPAGAVAVPGQPAPAPAPTATPNG